MGRCASFCIPVRALFRKNLLVYSNDVCELISLLITPTVVALFLYAYLILSPKSQTHSNCNFKPKAMPTGGGMSALQSFFCTFNNSCEEAKEASFDGFNSSGLKALEEALKAKFNIKPKNKREVELDLLELENYLQTIDTTVKTINKQNEKWNLLYKRILRSNIYSETNKNAIDDANKLLRVKRNMYKIGVTKSVLGLLINELFSSSPAMNLMNSFLCGPDIAPIETQLLENLDEPLPEIFGTNEQFQKDNELSDSCNDALKLLEEYGFKRAMHHLKPLLFGKLIYAPDAPVIDRVMGNLSKSIKKIKEFLDLMKVKTRAWEELSSLSVDDIFNKYKNDEHFLKEAVQTNFGKEFLKYYIVKTRDKSVESNLQEKMNKFQELLEETQQNYRRFFKEAADKPAVEYVKLLECLDWDRVISESSEGAAESKAKEYVNKRKLWGLVVFTNVPAGADDLPPSVTYKLRVPMSASPNLKFKKSVNVTSGPRSPKDLKAISWGTLHLQNLIEGELLREYTGGANIPGVYLQEMPIPCMKLRKREVVSLAQFFTQWMWAILYVQTVKRMVLEKEVLFYDLLRIFGVRTYHHYLAIFLSSFLLGCLASLLSSIIFSIMFGGFLIFFIAQVLAVASYVALGILTSSFFSKASFSTVIAVLIFFGLNFFYMFFQSTDNIVGIIFTLFVSNSAVCTAFQWIFDVYLSAVDLSVRNINYSPYFDCPLTLLTVLIMLVIDSIIYVALAFYFENILTKGSSRQPWDYCFKKSYWVNCCKDDALYAESVEQPAQSSSNEDEKKDPNNFEPDPTDLPAGIKLVNLSKEFGKGKSKTKVVDNISITFYESQITAFLGHNGAGKSTTVAMMTGMIPMTTGKIIIYGVDLRKNTSQALKSVGICMQENVLIGSLSTKDHLKLIGRLKNMSSQETKNNLTELLKAFELESRASQPVRQLSGGWKRKVCIAMAFMGGSRTIFLDEPTAGIDPFARRAIWDVVSELKNGRTIILITHHLDEADILGDRIAIISSGKIKCSGSGAFLKSQLNKGYTLTVDTSLRPDKSNTGGETKDDKKALSPQAQEITATVKSAIGNAEFEEERGCEVIISLPPKQTSNDLTRVFDALEKNKKRLNITSYGVSAASLDDVFISVLSEGEEKPKTSFKGMVKNLENPSSVLTESQMRQMYLQRQKAKMKSSRLLGHHFTALLIKRFLHNKRNYVYFIFQIGGPVLLCFLSLLAQKIQTAISETVIDVSLFYPGALFYTFGDAVSPRLADYEDALLGPYGLGPKCILYPGECSSESIPKGSLVPSGPCIDSNKCTCEDSTLVCSGNATDEPPNAKMPDGLTLFNMTGLDLANWLLATQFKYSLHRVGGLTLGHMAPISGVSIADFLKLFSNPKLADVLNEFLVPGKVINAADVSSKLMKVVNTTFGEQLFKGKDPSDNIIVWFNGALEISAVAMVNGVSNMVLRSSLPKGTDPSSYSIQIVVEPFHEVKTSSGEDKLSSTIRVLFFLILSCAILFALICMSLVTEKSCGFKHLEVINGVNPLMYWLVNFLWDIVLFTIFLSFFVIFIFIFDFSFYEDENVLNVIVATLFCYGITSLFFTYLWSLHFQVPAFAFFFCFFWFSGATFYSLIVFVIPTHDAGDFLIFIRKISVIVPEYCLIKTIYDVTTFPNFSNSSLFIWDLSTKFICHILINGAVYFLLLMLFEFRNVPPFGLLVRLFASLKTLCRPKPNDKSMDEDVAEEKKRVKSGKAKEENDMLIVKNLTKIYCRQKNPAVNHVYVGIKRGECLGLLGMNGAGKSTFFNMISGSVTPNSGDATIGGYRILYQPTQSRLLIGYCPQADALDPYLTPTDHLRFFCLIRGITGLKKKNEVDSMIERMDLTKHRNKLSKVLSGGNKRKLNASIALLCEPELVLLDEPTAGMDVVARRFLWSRMQEVLQDGRCLVLTTHSLEECQALATQVAIMFMGSFACYGSSQHLKSKFNDGYTVSLRLLKPDKIKDVTNFLTDQLPNSQILSVQYVMMRVKLNPDIQIGKAVSALGEAKKRQLIEDYSVTQTSLESVFLKLIGESDRTKTYQRTRCGCC